MIRLVGSMLTIALAVAVVVALIVTSDSEGAVSSKQKLRKSETVLAWYRGEGRWHLRPGYAFCADLRSPSASGRCWRHRQNVRWHRERVQRLTPKPQVGHLAGWLCIHSREGAWNDSGDPYWGGLQMTWGWMGLVENAAALSPMAQMQAAETGYRRSGYSDAWMRGQWPNTYPPCAHLF